MEHGCFGKRAYSCFTEAQKQINRRRRVVPGWAEGSKLTPYRCRVCHWWHIGNGVPVIKRKKRKWLTLKKEKTGDEAGRPSGQD